MGNSLQHKIILRLSILSLLCAMAVTATFGRDGGITADAPAVVTVDEAFSYTISGDIQGDVNLPALDGVKILSGPSQMVSYQSSNINGKLENTMQVSYTYMMKITSEGDFVIPPATLRANGKTYTTNEVKIKVIKGTADVQSSGPQGKSIPSEQGKSVIVRQIPSKTNVYVGEQLGTFNKSICQGTAPDHQP